jgi:hypothetical protein
VAGFRYALIVGLGAAMGIQNPAARKIAVPDLTTTVLTLTIALVTMGLGALASHTPGKRDPAWVRGPAHNSRPDCRQRKLEERKVEER